MRRWETRYSDNGREFQMETHAWSEMRQTLREIPGVIVAFLVLGALGWGLTWMLKGLADGLFHLFYR